MTQLATFIAALTFCVVSHAAPASEIPGFVFGEYRLKQPICFYTSVGPGVECEGFAYDTIAIEKKTPTVAYVGVTLMFQNAEMCHFHGVGRWNGKFLIASDRTYDERVCRLRISLENNHARVLEANDACSEFCAYHGSLRFTRSLPRRMERSAP